MIMDSTSLDASHWLVPAEIDTLHKRERLHGDCEYEVYVVIVAICSQATNLYRMCQVVGREG